MSERFAQKRWKIAVTVITLIALTATTWFLREQILDTIGNLRSANPWPVLLIIPLAALNHLMQGKLYQGVFRILGDRFRTKSMMRLSLEMNFVNNVFPSAGVSGFSYLSIRMKPEGVVTGKSTLVQIMRFALLFISFQILLGIGLLLLAVVGDVNSFVMLAAGSLATFLLLGTMFVIYLISNRSRLNGFFTTLTRGVNRLLHLLRPKHPETIRIARVERVFNELHDNYQLLRKHLSELKLPLVYALLANLTEIMAILSVFWAFGEIVNPGAVIIAYAVANFAGIISILPGGIGIYEGLMTGVFAAAGISPAISLPAVIAFRVTSMAVQIPTGYFFYQKSLQRHGLEPLKQAKQQNIESLD